MLAGKPARNGKPASPRSGKLLSRSVNPKLEARLAAAYSAFQHLDDPAADRICQRDFVFHMRDWEGDLRELAALYEHPERFSRNECEAIVSGFLMHATAHVMEAARLMLDYEPGYIFDSPKPLKRKNGKRKASASV